MRSSIGAFFYSSRVNDLHKLQQDVKATHHGLTTSRPSAISLKGAALKFAEVTNNLLPLRAVQHYPYGAYASVTAHYRPLQTPARSALTHMCQ